MSSASAFADAYAYAAAVAITKESQMTPAFALACWERAFTEELGIILTLEEGTSKRAVEKILYEARQRSGNPDLQSVSLVYPGDAEREIWLVKKPTTMEDVT